MKVKVEKLSKEDLQNLTIECMMEMAYRTGYTIPILANHIVSASKTLDIAFAKNKRLSK